MSDCHPGNPSRFYLDQYKSRRIFLGIFFTHPAAVSSSTVQLQAFQGRVSLQKLGPCFRMSSSKLLVTCLAVGLVIGAICEPTQKRVLLASSSKSLLPSLSGGPFAPHKRLLRLPFSKFPVGIQKASGISVAVSRRQDAHDQTPRSTTTVYRHGNQVSITGAGRSLLETFSTTGGNGGNGGAAANFAPVTGGNGGNGRHLSCHCLYTLMLCGRAAVIRCANFKPSDVAAVQLSCRLLLQLPFIPNDPTVSKATCCKTELHAASLASVNKSLNPLLSASCI